MTLFYRCIRGFVWFCFKLLYRHRTYRLAQIPNSGALIASNHASHYDPMIVGISWPTAIHYLARDTLFGPRLGPLIRRLNAHPIVREGADPASLRMIVGLLKEGDQVVIFPEGTRTLDGELQPVKAGIGMLALRSNVPIIPVYVHGTYDVWNRYRKRPKLCGKTACVIGEPVWPHEFLDCPKKEAQQKMTDRAMQTIESLKEWYVSNVLR